MVSKNNLQYPLLPEKKFFTIGEAAALALTKTHVVRYWEREISALGNVLRRRGQRRYYNVEEVLMLRQINTLINKEGYTIAGAGEVLAGKNNNASIPAQRIKKLRSELERIIAML